MPVHNGTGLLSPFTGNMLSSARGASATLPDQEAGEHFQKYSSNVNIYRHSHRKCPAAAMYTSPVACTGQARAIMFFTTAVYFEVELL